jgi:hypothetical protein
MDDRSAPDRPTHRLKRSVLRVHRGLKNHFIPHEGNNHVPRVLRHTSLVAYSAFLILVKVVVVTLPALVPASYLYSNAITAENIISLTNEARRSSGLETVKINARLASAAQAKADDIMIRQYFSHDGPTGERAWDFIRGAGYSYRYAGENLALHFKTAEAVNAGWLASPSHRANILSDRYREIGIGIAQGEFQGYPSTAVVQFFAAPTVEDRAVRPTTEKKDVPTAPGTVAASQVASSSVASPMLAPSSSQIAEAPAVRGTMETTPVIGEMIIRTAKEGFDIEVYVQDASEVRVLSDTAIVPLVEKTKGIWSGTIVPKNGLEPETWRVLARSAQGTEVTKPLAEFFPNAQAPEVYASIVPTNKFLTLFPGLTIQNIQKGARSFYLYALVFLAAAFLLNFFIKIRTQRWSVVAHTAAVIALALFLFLV